MPKKVSIIDKRNWLEKYEGGKSEAAIASESKRDIRTIKNGIEEARREVDIRLARAELLKEALRKHQDSLEGELRKILKNLELPHSDFAPLSWYRGNDSIFVTNGFTAQKSESARFAKVGRKPAHEATTVLDLLRQHFKNDRLWKWLADWEKLLISHLADRKALQRKAVAILEDKTGYKVIDNRDKVTLPFLYSHTAGHLLYKSALDSAFGSGHSGNMEDDMIADTQRGAVTYHNSILAEAPDHEEVTRSNILAAYRELLSSYELMHVLNTFGILKESVTRVRQAVEEILLLGFIPGQCDVCRRLGL